MSKPYPGELFSALWTVRVVGYPRGELEAVLDPIMNARMVKQVVASCLHYLSCVFETIVSCNDGNQWTSDECDPDTGECHNEPHTGGSCWFCVGDSCPNCPPEPYGRPFRCEDGACVCWL